jgi:hypothetical protein
LPVGVLKNVIDEEHHESGIIALNVIADVTSSNKQPFQGRERLVSLLSDMKARDHGAVTCEPTGCRADHDGDR